MCQLTPLIPAKALEPEVIELVHYFKISDRHARMLNEQLKLLDQHLILESFRYHKCLVHWDPVVGSLFEYASAPLTYTCLAIMLNQSHRTLSRRRNNTYEEDIASLYEILKGAKNPGSGKRAQEEQKG